MVPNPNPHPPANERTVLSHYTKDQSGKPIAGAFVCYFDQVQGYGYPRVSDGNGYSDVAGLITGNPYTWVIFANGYAMLNGYYTPEQPSDTTTATLSFKHAGGARRSGIVRVQDRIWVDDGGPFRPLGATLFWTVWGWTHDQVRLQQTFAWLAQRGVHFIRILGDVDWSGWGMQMDSSAPEWEDVLGACIDCAFDDYGLRTELTLWGGSGRDPLNCAKRALHVVTGREQKILDVEMANESFQNGPDDTTIAKMLDIFAGSGLVLAPSQPYSETDPVGACEAWLPKGADIATLHPDRTRGQHGERPVRQLREYQNMTCGANVNEPIGPRSSVEEECQPSKLAMCRGMGIYAGCAAYVLHNGNGVSGQPDPAHNRGGDLWSVPGIDEMHRAVYAVDQYLPIGVETWPKTTQHGGWAMPGFEDYGQPLAADAIWSDGWDHGCDRCYGAVAGASFVTMVSDVVGYVDLRAAHPCDCTATDVATGRQTQTTLGPGQVWRLEQAVAGTDLIVNGMYHH